MHIKPPQATVSLEFSVTPKEAEELARDAKELEKVLNRGDGDHFSEATHKLIGVLALLPQQFS